MIKFCLSDKLVNILIGNGIIISEDKDLYIYGLQQSFLIIINIATTIIIGLVFKMAWESVAFITAYMPLRVYAGGYHAKTQLRCYLFSVVLTLVVLLGIKLVHWTSLICLIVTLIAGLIIFFLAPVEDINKPLNQIEIRIYGKRAKVILSFEVCVLLLMMVLGMLKILTCILMAFAVLSIMLVLGKVNKYFIN